MATGHREFRRGGARGPAAMSIAERFARALADEQAGRPGAAERGTRAILAAEPGHAGALALLGALEARRGALVQAERHLRLAIARDPRAAFPRHVLGHLLLTNARHAEARAVLEEAVRLEPGSAVAHLNLGVARRRSGDLEGAIAAYQAAIAADRSSALAWRNLAGVLLEAGRLADAAPAYAEAHRLAPLDEEAGVGHGFVLSRLGRHAEAAASLASTVAAIPASHRARFHLACELLIQGRYAEGWPHFEARRLIGLARADGGTAAVEEHRPAGLGGREWRGEAAQGDRIVVWHEQGFGDTLQFCRYLTLAASRARVIAAVPAPLARLVGGIEGVEAVVDLASIPAHDAHCPFMSLAGIFETTPETVPFAASYLAADPARVTHWRETIGPDGFKVGLVWAGQHRADFPGIAEIDRRRSIPLAAFEGLAAIPRLRLFSLQKGEPSGEIEGAGFAIEDHTALLGDFRDTADFIGALDLVVSVDTAVAHLAGGLGHPVWLLNRTDTDWRWGVDRAESPWYRSMRIFRQSVPGDWSTVIDALAGALREAARA